jgi:hypothetical protein
VTEPLAGVMLGALHAVVGSFPLLYMEIPWARLPRGRGWTTGLALPLLLALHALLPRGKAAPERAFRLLATAMLVMLAVIMTSALQRMRLYQDAYGLTELRFYTTAFMGWLALLLAWFFATVLCGRRQRFAWGMLVTGFATVILLNAMNPDAVIARTNLARAAAGKPFDHAYLTALSADAVPILLEALPALPQAEAAALSADLARRWGTRPPPDWRTWNQSRAHAARLAPTNRQGSRLKHQETTR